MIAILSFAKSIVSSSFVDMGGPTALTKLARELLSILERDTASLEVDKVCRRGNNGGDIGRIFSSNGSSSKRKFWAERLSLFLASEHDAVELFFGVLMIIFLTSRPSLEESCNFAPL